MSHSPQHLLLRNQINAIIANAYERLERIASFDHRQACRIVSLIMQYCCAAQHVGGITAGRNAFKQLPADWVSKHLSEIIDESVNLADAWEYRRLLELLNESNRDLLQAYVTEGLKSKDPEITEAARDFANH